MIREILILDVTAMYGDNVCVAGIDLISGESIRLNQPQPNREQLKAIGWLQPGELVAVDVEPSATRTPPHVEDHAWNPRSVEKLRQLDDAAIWKTIRGSAFRSITEAFGESLPRRFKRNSSWKPGSGVRSLATIVAVYVRFDQDARGAIRVTMRDRSTVWGAIPLQDLVVREHRMKSDGCCSHDLLHNVRAEFEANACLVRVGLTRPFSPDEQEETSSCWLQVLNIFAKDRSHFV